MDTSTWDRRWRGADGEWVGADRVHRRRTAVLLTVATLLQLGIAAAVAAHGQPLTVHGQPGIGAGYAGCAIASAVAFIAVRRRPGPRVVAVGVVSLTGVLLVPFPPAALLPFGLAVVSAMVRGARVWALSSVAAALLLPVAEFALSSNPLLAVRSLGTALLLVIATVFGEGLRVRLLRARDRETAEVDRRRIAAEQERVRIARELHDVLAHSLSSITVQAGVGLHLAAGRPEAATQALETIRGTSRDALAEVRSVLGVLRGDDDAPRRPSPDLDAVGLLVRDEAATGTRVTLRDDLRPRPSAQVQLALYRIVQESLTNARRHAPGAAVDVDLAWHGDDAVATVRDSGTGTPTSTSAPTRTSTRPAPVAGNGILGMRERAQLLGGSLQVTAHPHGIAVVARIPAVSAPGPAPDPASEDLP